MILSGAGLTTDLIAKHVRSIRLTTATDNANANANANAAGAAAGDGAGEGGSDCSDGSGRGGGSKRVVGVVGVDVARKVCKRHFRPDEKRSFLVFSLCLSRACLDKTFVLYKMAQKDTFVRPLSSSFNLKATGFHQHRARDKTPRESTQKRPCVVFAFLYYRAWRTHGRTSRIASRRSRHVMAGTPQVKRVPF